MKLLCICILALLATSNVLALTLAKDGKSDYVIVLAQSPLPANARAAKELQTHFKQMTGVELPIRDDSQHPPAHSIIVGPNRFLEADKVLGNDGFMLTTSEQKLVIIGLGPRGTMYGVYELLEKLGVRWFTAKVTRVPKKSTVELADLNETQIPAFEYREPYFVEAWDKDWAARNRVIGNSPRLDESTGGSIKYADFVHTFDRLIPPDLYKTHPEYFPLVQGKRINGYVIWDRDFPRTASMKIKRQVLAEEIRTFLERAAIVNL